MGQVGTAVFISSSKKIQDVSSKKIQKTMSQKNGQEKDDVFTLIRINTVAGFCLNLRWLVAKNGNWEVDRWE